VDVEAAATSRLAPPGNVVRSAGDRKAEVHFNNAVGRRGIRVAARKYVYTNISSASFAKCRRSLLSEYVGLRQGCPSVFCVVQRSGLDLLKRFRLFRLSERNQNGTNYLHSRNCPNPGDGQGRF